jgi:hypothetical protein
LTTKGMSAIGGVGGCEWVGGVGGG